MCRREPDNTYDKYSVAVMKNNHIVGHLMKGMCGKFAKNIFYFLRASKSNLCKVTVKGKPINLGKGMGLQVPCVLEFTGETKMIDILKSTLLKSQKQPI